MTLDPTSPKSIACDDSGNVYVAGISHGIVSFDSVKFSGSLFLQNTTQRAIWFGGKRLMEVR